MYSPTLGRFITTDPIGFQAGDVNLYRFVGNNPANAIDPSGLQPLPAAPMPRRVDPLWTTSGLRHRLTTGKPFIFPGVTWKRSDGSTCKADVTVRVFGYRMFRDDAVGKDNRPGMFKVYIELEYAYKNVTCTKPCQEAVQEAEFMRSSFSHTMGNHIFLEGEVGTFIFRFEPGDFATFEQRLLDGFYNLKPDSDK